MVRNEVYVFGPHCLTVSRRRLERDGSPVKLGAREMDLLIHLVEHAGEVLSKEDLIAVAWPGRVVEEANLRVQLAALRRTLGGDDTDSRFIVNVPMRGYSFTGHVSKTSSPDHAIAPAAHGEPVACKPLPMRLTRLIGRDDAMHAIADSVRAHRLVTVVGPGGIGKTSIALACADRLLPHYREGARFVDLASVAGEGRVASAVAAATGNAALSDGTLTDLVAGVASKRLLLVLDNCEHVVGAVAELVEAVMAGAPNVAVLATSREPLRAFGEWVHRLHPLPLPPADTPMPLSEAIRYPGVELFVERALATDDALVFQDADVPLIVRLCRRIDGVPLAIELAAARIRTFGLSNLVERLAQRFDVLSGGRRTALARHQALGATLDWSYALLGDDEQHLLRGLSIFREHFSLDSALCVAADDMPNGLEALSNLVDKSLVTIDNDAEDASYRLLETTRAYATAKLATSGELQATAKRHALHFCDLLQLANRSLPHQAPVEWRAQHGRKIDDVRAALDWACSEDGDPAIATRLAALSAPLWSHLGLLGESIGYLRLATSRLDIVASDPRLALDLWLPLAYALMMVCGVDAEVKQAWQRAREAANALGEQVARERVSWTRFAGANYCGNHRAAMAETQRFLRVADRTDDAPATLVYRRMLALSQHLGGDQPRARASIELALGPGARSVGRLHASPDQFEHRAASLALLARIEWLLGHEDAARNAACEAWEAARQADHAATLTYALAFGLCPVALWLDDLELAGRGIQALSDSRHPFWKPWQNLYTHAFALRQAGPWWPPPVLDTTAFTHAHSNLLITLGVDYLPEDALARARNGLMGWCAPEALRVAATRLLAQDSQARSDAHRLLLEAEEMAAQQGAQAWRRRIAVTLAASA